MEKLDWFERTDYGKLLSLARRLNDDKFFDVFLTEYQLAILQYVISLDKLQIWESFLEGNIQLLYKCDTETAKDSESASADAPELLFEEGQVALRNLAFNVRYLLWEMGVDFYYKDGMEEDNNHDGDSYYKLIEAVNDEEDIVSSAAAVDGSSKPEILAKLPKIEKPILRNLNDDYDDDDDEEEDDDDEARTENNTDKMQVDDDNSTSEFKFLADSKVLVLEVPLSIFRDRAQQAPTQAGYTKAKSPLLTVNQNNGRASTPAMNSTPTTGGVGSGLDDQERLIRDSYRIYHNFEYDRKTLIKRRKLELSDERLEKNSKDNNNNNNKNNNNNNGNDLKQNGSTESLIMGFEVGNSSLLKHLLNAIQSQRDDIDLNDHELRSLFMNVRKNRGKWANDERVGQEELYEACEKVIIELRGYTEHSTPFLNKVSKREAPNYALIIKKPMDLNTVMKKLKNFSYTSKQEFVDDVMLIWSNCLTYNADPKHFLRVHALAMQKKAMKLIPSIPNIVVRKRSEIEKEENELADNENGGKPKAAGHISSTGKSLKKGRKRSREGQGQHHPIKLEENDVSALGSPIPDGTAASTAAGTPIPNEETSAVKKPIEDTEEVEEDDAEEEDDDDDEDEDDERINNENARDAEAEQDDEIDPELIAWRSMTAKSRAHYCAQRAEMFGSDGKLCATAPALLRKSLNMKKFIHYLNPTQALSKTSNLLVNDEPYLLEYDVSDGVPGLEYKGIDEHDEEKWEQHLVDIYLQLSTKEDSPFVLSQKSGLNKLYVDNISQIQEIRRICFKIALIRQMQTQQFLHHTQMKPPEIETLKEVDVDPVSKLTNHDPYTYKVQYGALRRSIAKVIMQTGFESTEPFAINTMTQVAEKFLCGLIKSLKTHTETTSKNKLKSSREVILLSLLENGIFKPDDLYTFVKERIIKQQQKLFDLHTKLKNFLKELLRPGLENMNEKNFDDNSDLFVTGDFLNEIGDDFFGLKELGLDKEYELMSSSMPLYMLHTRLHNSFSNNNNANRRSKYEDLKDYEPGNLTASSIKDQIGILKPFYTKLLERSKVHFVKQQKKKNESTEFPPDDKLLLIEDEELPQKNRNIRPRLPPTGKISSIKKKVVANAMFLPEVDEDMIIPKQEQHDDAGEEEDGADDNDLASEISKELLVM
ncbi:Transcriptional activator spt7 [Scheffersomyces spartinae]|uniref:SAGA complex subunit Spt7 n=1 Tax=Scheffersomyces spartinae TaxID=45513 RepID=A0A9P7V644_9ASCO|nr:Transcriptional activator spt7 [Scheffersomyces spartinae]KAG7191908.1 Transcriptional activator spt7 [Scheffersomyces spartinae]